MTDDRQLLTRYVESGDQAAFLELVQRHLQMVYSVALRGVGGDVHLAQDVAQTVFAALARKARALQNHRVLGGWLYRSARFAARDTVRSEQRRKKREQEAQLAMLHQENNDTPDSEIDWETLRPEIDAALAELSDIDRDAVVLRFFHNLSYSDIGDAIDLSENAARMRVSRALEKLNTRLVRRGIASSLAALNLVLAGHVQAAVPAGLAATIATSATAVASTATAVGLGNFVLHVMNAKSTIAIASLVTVVALVSLHDTSESRAAILDRIEHLETQRARYIAEAERLEAEAVHIRASIDKAMSSVVLARIASRDSVTEAGEPITRERVMDRLNRAMLEAFEGRYAQALEGYIWCYDIGYPTLNRNSSYAQSMSMSGLDRLIESYPPAKEAFTLRRDKAETQLGDPDALRELAGTWVKLNQVLGETNRSIELFDSLEDSDRLKRTIGIYIRRDLVEAKRYADALAIISPERMRSTFEMKLGMDLPNATTRTGTARSPIDESTFSDIEILAGAGKTDEAVAFTLRVLEVDDSETTRQKLSEHLARAGRGDLLEAIGEN